jgi:2-(1,2-epoxy-1,2-dihydrophenyl)acetyl-CoA isomerase
MPSNTIRLERPNSDHARLVLDNAASHNALGTEELQALAMLTDELATHPPKVLSILAEGPCFGVGGDLKAMAQAISENRVDAWLTEAITTLNQSIMQLRALDSAIVVGVQGAVAGGTLGLVWVADHVIVTDNLRLNLAYARIGGSPDGGTSWFLPRLVNPLRAFELFTLCPTLDAQQTYSLGLANRIVPVQELRVAVDDVISHWLNVPSVSLTNFKRLLRQAHQQTLRNHLQQELCSFVEASGQLAFNNRVQEFFER